MAFDEDLGERFWDALTVTPSSHLDSKAVNLVWLLP